jgi:hypothetical protein
MLSLLLTNLGFGGTAGAVQALAVTTLSIPNGTQNIFYTYSLAAAGGAAPYSFSVTSGTLPTGMTLSSSGLLSGVPSTDGSYTFTVTVTDIASNTVTHTYSNFYIGRIFSELTILITPGPTSLSAAANYTVATLS